MIDEVIAYAESHLWIPYIYGGKNYFGLDCSGFVCSVLKGFGMLGYHEELNAQQLFDRFQTTPRALQRGSLMFFGPSPSSIKHVAIATSPYSMIEAGGGDETCIDMQTAMHKNACVRRRGTRSRIDLYCSVLPKFPWD